MRTKTTVHTPGERRELRMAGELRAQMSMVQLLCVTSILRTTLTQIIPLAGSTAWWTMLLCFLPGMLTAGLLRLAMRLSGTATLANCFCACFGRRIGGCINAIILPLVLLLDGAASLTALVTMFTQGIGTRGTQLTMALLTCAVLLCCLHREGLPRAVYLLRPLMLTGAAVMAICGVQSLRVDGLFPLHGAGDAAMMTALRAGVSLAWPISLLLTLPAGKRPRSIAALPPLALCVAVVLFLTLTCPHELLIRQQTLAGRLLLPAVYAAPALRTLAQCLLMLALFLGTGGAVQTASEQLCAPRGSAPVWLPYVLLALLAGTQLLDPALLWHGLSAILPWLLAPLLIPGVLCLLISPFRRKRV